MEIVFAEERSPVNRHAIDPLLKVKRFFARDPGPERVPAAERERQPGRVFNGAGLRLALLFPFALVALAVAVAFRAAPSLGFVDYDDPVAVLDPALRGGLTSEAFHFALTASPANLWHPLTFLTHALDFELFGERAGGHHFVSVLIHLGSSLLLLGWLRRQTGETSLALAVALLFAIHPLRVESVVWLSERKDVLSVFFCLLTVVFYSEWTRSPRRRHYYGLALAAALLGLLSKPSLMTLPGILILVDFWPLRRVGRMAPGDPVPMGRILLEKVPFLALAVVAAVTAWLTWSGRQVLIEAAGLPFPERVGYSGLAYVSYLSRTLFPVDLVPFLPYPLNMPRWQLAAAVAVIVVLTLLSLQRARNSPWIAAGWFWFLGAILPGSGLVTISDHFAPDRYSYLAHAGLFTALVWEARHLGRRFRIPPAAGWLVFTAIALALGFLTDRQTRVWRNATTLWTHTLAAKGPHFLPLNQLGLALVHDGRIEEGIRRLEEADSLAPQIPMSAANLALALASVGRCDEAYRRYREAVVRLSGHDRIRDELIRRFHERGRDDLAGLLWKESVAADPSDGARHLEAATFFYATGNEPEALAHYAEAARLAPREMEATLGLGAILLKQGRTDEALPWLERSLANARGAAEEADARRTLAQAHLLAKRWREAQSSYEAAVALAPERPLLLNELAQLLLDCPDPALRNPKRALDLAEQVEQMRKQADEPLNPRFLRTLAKARERNGRAAEALEAVNAGLGSVSSLLQEEPVPKPWTREELGSLETWFRAAAARLPR
jgi:tetratricopeptide (TPR) repeat protein